MSEEDPERPEQDVAVLIFSIRKDIKMTSVFGFRAVCNGSAACRDFIQVHGPNEALSLRIILDLVGSHLIFSGETAVTKHYLLKQAWHHEES